MHRRIIPVQKLPTIYLKPGEVLFGLEPTRVITVLGSCVSVIMYYRPGKIGAICHAVMPAQEEAAKKNRSNAKDELQYVDSSVQWMLARFEKIGIKGIDLEVKIFGGSELFYDSKKYDRSISVGKKNVEMALKTIQAKNLKLKAWNVGGNKGRKVIFYTDTGEVFTKFVNKVEPQVALYMTGSEK
jgi:chemotaxis protein CheD